ncbi:MAG: 16S rRNA (guanine(966)-N(2))-methyltransferase RsmD [Candidatus Omnitrophica bacterium]|nr:16S rRNA (guanine(966)-N(2))-methyltransferase RsmD [Candidatus Omnitrophota bacterium]
MRIIAGKFKGRVIEMTKGTRPTSDKVREALFEILKNRIVGARFLDLYCGSGAVGIEAFSRGAKNITFVDNNLRCIAALKENLNQLDIKELYSIHIYKKEVLKALEEFNRLSMTFDVIFLDPPYYKDMARNTLIALSNYDILPPNTVVVAEVYKKEILPETIGFLEKTRISTYGDTKLEFFINKR